MTELEKAQKALFEYMDSIRSNYIGGLTEMTSTQRTVLDQLYEKVLLAQ